MSSTVNSVASAAAAAATNAATAAATNSTSSTTSSSGTASNSAATSTGTNAQTSLNSDFQQFLTLLTTQLQNQDPTAPLDTNQITQQIASLSQVQQQIDTNTQLQNLVSLFTSNQATNAASYIGKQVDATGNQIELTTTASTSSGSGSSGNAALVYNMPAGASSATVSIMDSTGAVVYTGTAPTTTGRNELDWNGVNSKTGATEPSGTYTFSIVAKDSASKTISPAPTTYTTGIVTAVDTQNGVNTLALGNISVPLNSVQALYTAGTNPGA